MISQGRVELTKTFESGIYEFVCPPIQGLTLMLFNESQELSFCEIKNFMGFDNKFCKKVLDVFINPKYKILEKFPDNKNRASEQDSLKVNSGFFNNLKRIKLPAPSQDKSFDNQKIAADNFMQLMLQ